MEDIKQEQQEENKNHRDPNSDYAEDCFLFDMTENSNIHIYNPNRYLTFNYLSSGVARLKGCEEIKDIELEASMRDYFFKCPTGFFQRLNCLEDKGLPIKDEYSELHKYEYLDEYLHENVYKKRIDDWIDKVKDSKAKAVKVVLYSHGSEDRCLFQPELNSCEHIQKDAKTKKTKYTGENIHYDDRTVKCLKYFFQRLSEVKKNINIVNRACYAAEYLDEKKQHSIIEELIKPLAKKIHNYNKDIIYTCNYSEKNIARNECWRKYYRYDGEQKKFVSLSPNLDSDNKLKQNVKDYGKYTIDSTDETAKLRAEYYNDKNNLEYGAKYKDADLRLGMAFIRDIKDKLSSYGTTEEQKEWAQKKITELNDDLKNWQSLRKKIKFLNNIKLKREDLIKQENIDVQKVIEQAKSDFSKTIKYQTTKSEKAIMKDSFNDIYWGKFKQNLEKEKEALQLEQQKNIQCWKDFFQKHKECFESYTKDVKLHHKRHRSHELFFDAETVKRMKEAKDRKNEILFELNKDKNEIKEENKEEESFLNDAYSISNGWMWHDEDLSFDEPDESKIMTETNKSQINEIKEENKKEEEKNKNKNEIKKENKKEKNKNIEQNEIKEENKEEESFLNDAFSISNGWMWHDEDLSFDEQDEKTNFNLKNKSQINEIKEENKKEKNKDKNEIKEENKKEEEKNKNEIITEANFNLKNKSQINEINGY